MSSKVPENVFVGWAFPLFAWVPCAKCKQKFRRTPMWQFNADRRTFREETYYLCRDCAPTKDDASDYITLIHNLRPCRPRLKAKRISQADCSLSEI